MTDQEKNHLKNIYSRLLNDNELQTRYCKKILKTSEQYETSFTAASEFRHG